METKTKPKKTRSPKRTLEIVASVSAVIPTGNYENFKPMYSVKDIVSVNGNADEVISRRTDELRSILKTKLDDDYEKLRIERIKRQRQDLRFTERGGKTYPHVTSIISAIEPIDYDPEKLKQYASRGSIVHAQIYHFLTTQTWEDNILKIPGTKLDYIVVTQGNLKLKWTDCNFRGFWEKYGSKFAPIDGEGWAKYAERKIFNDEYVFCGSPDLPCLYDGRVTLADYKTASIYDNEKLDKYWRQLAAYAKTFLNIGLKIEQLLIIPLNPSNKSGYGQPIIEKDIDKYFGLFLQDRSAFKTIYGI